MLESLFDHGDLSFHLAGHAHPCPDFSTASSSFASIKQVSNSKASHHDEISIPGAILIGFGIASTLGFAVSAAYRVVHSWTLRDSSTQIPEFDMFKSVTPTGRHLRIHTPSLQGETGDPSAEFLSPTPTGGRVKPNNRRRFF